MSVIRSSAVSGGELLPQPPRTIENDAFMSYRDKAPVNEWVRTILVPRLRREGLRVLLDRDSFTLGAYAVDEMERGIEESHYTVAVFSGGYLKTGFTSFENLLAEHLGLEQRKRRLIAVIRERSDKPLRIRARLYLDMTNDETFESDVARLIATLRSPP